MSERLFVVPDISERVVSDEDLGKMFDAVDDDGSGEIDCEEFETLLTSDALAQDMTFEVFYEAMFQLVDLWTSDPPKVENYENFLAMVLSNITKPTADGKCTLRDLTTMYDDKGVLMYELAPVDEIESFVNDSGDVQIEGVEINEEMTGQGSPRSVSPEPKLEQEPEVVFPDPEPEPWILTEVPGSEIEARLPDYEAEERERARLAAEKEAARVAALEAERLRREAEDAQQKRRAKMDLDVTIPLPRSQGAMKARRNAFNKRRQELAAEEDARLQAMALKASQRPEWWAQIEKLMEGFGRADLVKLDGNLLGKFPSWGDAKKLVTALMRAICEATANIDTEKGQNPNEAVALAVAKELRQNGEITGLLRLIIADADEPGGIVALPADMAAANHIVGARLLAWLQRILEAHLSAAELPPTLRSSQRFATDATEPMVAQMPRHIVTPGTAKRRQVHAKKAAAFQATQQFRTKRPQLQPRLRRIENTGTRAPDIAGARRKLQSLSYSAAGQDPMRLFQQYDHDNSGELDFEEFCSAVRKGGQMTPSMISDNELAALFSAVDGDGSGDVSIEELRDFVWGQNGGSEWSGKKAKLKLPTVNAHRTKDGLSDKPVPRYMQPHQPKPPPARDLIYDDEEEEMLREEILRREGLEADVRMAKERMARPAYHGEYEGIDPRDPREVDSRGDRLPLLPRAKPVTPGRVTFSREGPRIRQIESARQPRQQHQQQQRGAKIIRGRFYSQGPPGNLKPSTPVYSAGRKFLPPESVDWSKSITARF